MAKHVDAESGSAGRLVLAGVSKVGFYNGSDQPRAFVKFALPKVRRQISSIILEALHVEERALNSIESALASQAGR